SDEQQPQNPGSGSSAGPGGSAAETSAGNGGSPSTSGGDNTGAPSSDDSTGSPSSDDSTGAPSTDSGPAGAGDFSERGVCGQRGRSTVMAASFEGFEELYIIGDRGLGEDVCVVRFDVTRTGDGQPGRAELDGQPRSGTHEVAL